MELRLKDILQEKRVSQKELAEQLGITEVGLSKSLNGNPTISRLQDIANALGVDFIELFVAKQDGTTGYIEHNGEVHKINSISDIEDLIVKVKGLGS